VTDDLNDAMALAAGVAIGGSPLVSTTAELEAVEPGWLDKRIILPTKVWVDEHGVTHRLEDMSVEYRANVIAHLDRFEDTWAVLALFYVTGETLLGNIPRGESIRQHQLVALLTPGWIRQTPLVRRLQDLNDQAADGTVEPGNHP
jgi:hypothetical protein